MNLFTKLEKSSAKLGSIVGISIFILTVIMSIFYVFVAPSTVVLVLLLHGLLGLIFAGFRNRANSSTAYSITFLSVIFPLTAIWALIGLFLKNEYMSGFSSAITLLGALIGVIIFNIILSIINKISFVKQHIETSSTKKSILLVFLFSLIINLTPWVFGHWFLYVVLPIINVAEIVIFEIIKKASDKKVCVILLLLSNFLLVPVNAYFLISSGILWK